MKSSDEVMQDEAVAEKQMAVHTMLDVIKWLYASGLALNGAALLKLADADVLGTPELVAGGLFFIGLLSCFIAAAMLGAFASQALDAADNKLKLLFAIKEGRAKAADLQANEQEDLEKGEPQVKLMGYVLAASLACFILALLALGIGAMANRLEQRIGQAEQRIEQALPATQPKKAAPPERTDTVPSAPSNTATKSP